MADLCVIQIDSLFFNILLLFSPRRVKGEINKNIIEIQMR